MIRGNQRFKNSRFKSNGGQRTRGSQNQDLGTNAPVLNFKPGQITSAISVAQWLTKVKDAIAKACPKYGLKNIINVDGTIGEYPLFEAPEAPVDIEDFVETTIWKAKISSYEVIIRELSQDKKEAANVVWNLIGEMSRTRIEEYNEGLEAPGRYNLDDPIQLLSIAVKTHFGDWRMDNSMKTSSAQKYYINIAMTQEESLVSYHRRWTVLKDAYSKALDDDEFPAPSIEILLGHNHDQVVRFISSLDVNRFGQLISDYRTGHKDWPGTVLEAYNEAHIWVDNQVTSLKRGIFVAKPVIDDVKTSEKSCYRCGASGHLQNHCNNVLVENRNIGGRNTGRGGGRGRSGRGRGRGRGRNNSELSSSSGTPEN
jgi:hypothetical protein